LAYVSFWHCTPNKEVGIMRRILASKFRGVACDLEGTIIDLEALHFHAFVLAVQEYGVVTSPEEIQGIPLAIGGGDRVIAEGLVALYQLDVTPSALIARKVTHYRRRLAEVEVKPRAGFLDFLQTIQAAGIPYAIGSLTPRIAGEELLQRSGLDRYFSQGMRVFLEDVTHRKPAPDVYLKTAALLGVDPSTQVVFEDSEPGVLAARAAGSTVYALPIFWDEGHLDRLRQAGAAAIFQGWEEVS
jgi:HAD superfamily hydrolase (TIGR01509 family)